jgi:hypothetical protein
MAARLDDLARLTRPLGTFAAALCERRRRGRDDRREEDREERAPEPPRMRGGWPRDDEGPVIKPA